MVISTFETLPGSNAGLKRVCATPPGEPYHDLLYVRRRYLHPDALRNAIAEVVNAIFRIRAAHIWGEGTTAPPPIAPARTHQTPCDWVA
jgi:hypothetical protein